MRETYFYLNRIYFYSITIFCVITVASVSYYLLFDSGDTFFFTPDSVHYKEQALGACERPWGPVIEAFSDGNLVKLNWTTIVSVGGMACFLFGNQFDVAVFILNLSMFFLVLLLYAKALIYKGVVSSRSLVFYVLFLFQIFIVVSLPSLNKELFVYFFVASMYFLFLKEKKLSLFVLSIAAGLVKVQLFLVGVALILMLLRVRGLVMLVALSILLPLVFWRFSPEFLDARAYFARYEYAIRSENIAVFLNDIASYPFGYVVVMPIRFFLNMLSGFSPVRLFSTDTSVALMYAINAFSLSILAFLVMMLSMLRNSFNSVEWRFVFVYSMIFCLIPFFQLRYFFPLMPLFVIILISGRFNVVLSRKKMLSIYKDTSDVGCS